MRYILIALAIYHGLNGAFMLVAPELWYNMAPGASHTGPFNGHFLKDIGLAFLAASFALGYSALWTVTTGVILTSLVFTGGHAALHFVEMIEHGAGIDVWLRDTLLILIPGLLPVLALRHRNQRLGTVR
ncbi:hypothetical protein [Cucumibacter marinus]|uniref:hypothetical protein n=1 Tax=Cucumibacter marinus TaxID=1121252 RepID=UPI0004027100|nr:hypothetical protein [Cucumibacter marinus]